jgi:hypothetical protein
MTQISRPFQLVLLATGLFAVVWFVALRGHSASTQSAGSSASAPAASAPAKAAKPSSSSPVYHGSAPGVEGLTRAINKAHAAVAQSQQNARQLKEKAAQASSPGGAAATSATSSGGSQVSGSSKQHPSAASTHAASKAPGSPSAGRSAGTSAKAPAASSGAQASVEGQLKQGKTVAILFWNPQSSVDVTVRRELQAAEQQLGGTLAVHLARSSQVGSFGTFTRDVQVYSTPTILLVNKQGETTVLTGLTDVFSLKQAVAESRHAK